MNALELTLLYLLAAVLGVVACRMLRLPPMLGYLAVGVVIGPNALALAQNSSGIQHLAAWSHPQVHRIRAWLADAAATHLHKGPAQAPWAESVSRAKSKTTTSVASCATRCSTSVRTTSHFPRSSPPA